jgi:hypothetical protein
VESKSLDKAVDRFTQKYAELPTESVGAEILNFKRGDVLLRWGSPPFRLQQATVNVFTGQIIEWEKNEPKKKKSKPR